MHELRVLRLPAPWLQARDSRRSPTLRKQDTLALWRSFAMSSLLMAQDLDDPVQTLARDSTLCSQRPSPDYEPAESGLAV